MNDIPNVVLRLGNVYSPRQTPHGEAGVVAIFSDRLAKGLQPIVYGDGSQTRDYIHVSDVSRAFLFAAESGRAASYNVGTGRATSVLEVLASWLSLAAERLNRASNPSGRGEMRRSCLDSSRLRGELGWKPLVELEAGLRSTFATYLS